MRIYGLDFSSSPSRKKKKFLTLAECDLKNDQLTVLGLSNWPGLGKGPFEEFESWLAKPGEWVAGIDFPFGMPAAAVEYFGWLQEGRPENWETYVGTIAAGPTDVKDWDVDAFCKVVELWQKAGRGDDSKRVFLTRHADKLATFGGATPSSPMKVNLQCNPPVGRMFFEGANRLRVADVSICPVRVTGSKKVVVEAYPRLVADKVLKPGVKYKDAKETASYRTLILTGLKAANKYGILLSFANENMERTCVGSDQDNKGDALDSVLCAVQAAWSFRQELDEASSGRTPRTQRFGTPIMTSTCMRQLLALEGWICDPLLLSHVWHSEGTADEPR